MHRQRSLDTPTRNTASSWVTPWREERGCCRNARACKWPDAEVPTACPAGPLTEVDPPCRRSEWHGSLWSILSKKVFLAGEKDFSAPLVHPARADVRDHVESQEGDHRASYASDRGLQKRRQRKTDFREIRGAAQFLTFSTASVNSAILFAFAARLVIFRNPP